MVNTENFRIALIEILEKSQKQGLSFVDIRSGDLHRSLGDYPGPNHRMPLCCSVMRNFMDQKDMIIASPPRGNGATLVIRYHLPRTDIDRKK